MVEIDQPFYAMDGCLCQKIEDNSYNTIADDEEKPSADYYPDVESDMEIKAICKHVKTISVEIDDRY